MDERNCAYCGTLLRLTKRGVLPAHKRIGTASKCVGSATMMFQGRR